MNPLTQENYGLDRVQWPLLLCRVMLTPVDTNTHPAPMNQRHFRVTLTSRSKIGCRAALVLQAKWRVHKLWPVKPKYIIAFNFPVKALFLFHIDHMFKTRNLHHASPSESDSDFGGARLFDAFRGRSFIPMPMMNFCKSRSVSVSKASMSSSISSS